MITTRLLNTNPELFHAIGCAVEVCTIGAVEETLLCDCSCPASCEIHLKAFVNINGCTDTFDQREFLYRLETDLDTINIELWKMVDGCREKQADLNDNSLGTFYDLGSFNSCPGQDLYAGYFLNWKSVHDTYGPGYYFVVADMVVVSNPVQVFSHQYHVQNWTRECAANTFVIKSIQNGDILDSPFDYSEMNWQQEIRLPGKFWNRQHELEKTRYKTTNRRRTQVQDELIDKFTLEVHGPVDHRIGNHLIHNILLADDITITDQNFCNAEPFCNFQVDVDSIPKTNTDGYAPGITYEITFTDRFKRSIKRSNK